MNYNYKISDWLLKYITDFNMSSFIIGVSGGIDSAVVSALCAETGKKTIVISMPIHQNTQQLKRANNHIKWLNDKYENVESMEIDLTGVFNNFKKLFTKNNNLALANSRSRLRMTALYQIAGENNGLVVGTGNKIEDFGIGFFTKYGDGGVDLSPIADLTKTEVREMAKVLNINGEIINAKPTDGLWDDDRCDEDQIGASYEELEWAMSHIDNTPYQELTKNISDREKEVLSIYMNFHKRNKHKMIEIPIFKK